MKKIYAEPMTKVMKLNVNVAIMDDTIPTSGTGKGDDQKADPLPLF